MSSTIKEDPTAAAEAKRIADAAEFAEAERVAAVADAVKLAEIKRIADEADDDDYAAEFAAAVRCVAP